MSVDFMNPLSFLLLLLIPLFFTLKKINFFSRIALPLTFADWNGWVFTWKDESRKIINFVATTFLFLGYIALVIAVAEPVVHHQERIYTSRGTDVLFLLDTSPSMAARDINGMTRLDAARSTIEKIIMQNTGASYGLILMGSEAAVGVPLTNDLDAFKNRLNTVSIGMMGDGTAIGIGLSLSVYHIKSTQSKKKCIILLTDGENNAGSIHPETASALAKKNDITLYTVGIGTRGNVPIEYVNPKTGKLYSGFLNSNFDSTQLEKIAIIADGRYYSVETVSALSIALSSIIKRQDVVQSYYIKNVDDFYYDEFLIASLICFGLAWIIKRLYLKEFI